jgi:SulP family sulfate permease
MAYEFEPKIITVFKEGYKSATFLKDLMAGIIVGIVALPLSIAFAIASGVRPEQGLYTAIIAGFLISAFSGSRVQIGGPTGAFIVIVYDIIQKYGYEGLCLATIMAGVMLIIFGLARFGDVIKYIPYPVTVGFTSGIAVIIFTTQIKDFLGLPLTHLPEHFWDQWTTYVQYGMSFNIYSVGLGLTTILFIVFWPRVTHKIPGTLIALIVTTAIVHFFHLPVETITSRFGEVPNTFRPPQIPQLNLEHIIALSGPAMTICLLAGIESLLSAVVADGMMGTRHRSNMELIAQGIANIVSPIFQGIPATGAIARTATNIKNGGKTPIAGIIHALTLLFIFLYLGKLAGLIPMATLSGILIVVAYNMSEWHLFVKLFKGPKSDICVLLTTFLLTVLIDLTVAIEVGIVLAAFLFMRRMIAVTEVDIVTQDILREDNESSDPMAISKRKIPGGVEVFEINGPFFFGAADKFRNTLRELREIPKVMIFRMRYVPAIDATGLHALDDAITRLKKNGTIPIISEASAHLRQMLHKGGIVDLVHTENMTGSIDEALVRAGNILGGKT